MEVNCETNGDSFIHGQPRPWTEVRTPRFASISTRAFYDLSPDGKRLIVPYFPPTTEERKGNVQVTFLLNFFDELQRRVP
jgi:hypothetical protein